MSNNTPIERKTIPVVVDKSHLVTIGERLYTEKTSFIRELVNNAYDADATEVYVDIMPDKITLRDNGSGMDEAGLRQYFTIGSNLKKSEDVSPRFKRARIGEFGIGKFAALAACKRFEVETQKGDFHARLVFDKDSWSRHEDWHLNIDVVSADSVRGNGTIVTLHELNTSFAIGKVRRYLAERTPIHVPNFAVFLNSERVSDDVVAGRQLSIQIMTQYGHIEGHITITPTDRRAQQLGIGVTVKGVLVRYEPFGMETSRKWGVTRITGRVNADFLVITSGRDDFIRDTPEFVEFSEAMKKEIKKALGIVREEGDRKANLQASRVLKGALQRIGRAMRRHHELFPGAQIPIGVPTSSADPQKSEGYSITEAEFLPSHAELDSEVQKRLEEQGKEKKSVGRPRGILGSKSVIRTLHIANLEIAIRMEHLGNDEESLISGGVIYVNLDHPLYRTYQNNDEMLMLHISRVITKDLALQTGISDASRAFAIQGELLTDAFKGKGV